MAEAEGGFKVSDRRILTEEGELKEEAAKAHETQSHEAVHEQHATEASSPKEEPELSMDFKTLVFSFRMNALVQLGILANPVTNKAEKDLRAAKQSIDILEVLNDKTKGNLDAEEAQLLEASLYELKLSYLQASNQIKL
ncbi:MAG TPA: DUF1844 domain-containing protein [Terriglobia bacterium]|nr:DUF1844 domain-containing protein [Terriglobia bacterium]